jgi:hypothetical protein
MFRYEITIPEHFDDLIPRLRHYDRLEMEMSGFVNLTSEEQVNMHTELYSVFDENNVLQAMYGCVAGPVLLYLTFVGTDEIFNHTKLYTKNARAYIYNRKDRYFWITPTVCVHPENSHSRKWMERALGFTDTGWKTNGLMMYQIKDKYNLEKE